eukprot:3574917-Amphidinium_carterae.1
MCWRELVFNRIEALADGPAGLWSAVAGFHSLRVASSKTKAARCKRATTMKCCGRVMRAARAAN